MIGASNPPSEAFHGALLLILGLVRNLAACASSRRPGRPRRPRRSPESPPPAEPARLQPPVLGRPRPPLAPALGLSGLCVPGGCCGAATWCGAGSLSRWTPRAGPPVRDLMSDSDTLLASRHPLGSLRTALRGRANTPALVGCACLIAYPARARGPRAPSTARSSSDAACTRRSRPSSGSGRVLARANGRARASRITSDLAQPVARSTPRDSRVDLSLWCSRHRREHARIAPSDHPRQTARPAAGHLGIAGPATVLPAVSAPEDRGFPVAHDARTARAHTSR